MLDQLRGGLVVSCQPVSGGPMDRPEIVAAMARAAIAGGAAGVRIEGLANLQATRSAIHAPIIALIKRDDPATPVRITPRRDDVLALCGAGADIVAYDATSRPRPEAPGIILSTILSTGALAMADCAAPEDGRRAREEGAQILGTTLSGYADTPPPEDGAPDLDLVRRFRTLGGFVMAEGRYNTPALAARAIAAGADAVTVGSALTRLEHATHWFCRALEGGRGP